MPALLAAAVLAVAPLSHPAAVSGCSKTFTGPMVKRAINVTYGGTRDVSATSTRHLRRYLRCARPHVSRARLSSYLTHARQAWVARRNPPMNGPVTASWYGLGGSGACGTSVQSGYRFASLFLTCGQMIRMCHGARCVDAQSADRGPYVGGRTFDLNANLRDALACGDLCAVTWRPL